VGHNHLARGVWPFLVWVLLFGLVSPSAAQEAHRYLYVGIPGVDDDTLHRGVSIAVFDIDRGHAFVKRIEVWPPGAAPETVRGIAAGPPGARLYISTTRRLAAVDLASGKIIWENDYGGHCCERMAVSPDGRTIYAPAFGSPVWYVIEAASGVSRGTIRVLGWPRSTVYAQDGSAAYLAAWESPLISIADTKSLTVTKEVGPFSGYVCPFTVNRKATLAFANVDGLLGFEVGDLHTGLILDRVELSDYSPEQLAQYECPSHGIAFTPDEKELWVADGVGNRLRIFDSTTYPPVEKGDVPLARQPRWISFSLDGRYAYASTGEVVDVAAKRVLTTLKDEDDLVVESERMIEVDMPGAR